MDFDADELSRGIGLCHPQQAVTHTKANLNNASARKAKGLIPVELPCLKGEAKAWKSILPATLLSGRHPASAHHKAAHTVGQRGLGGSHSGRLRRTESARSSLRAHRGAQFFHRSGFQLPNAFRRHFLRRRQFVQRGLVFCQPAAFENIAASTIQLFERKLQPR